MDQLPSVWGQHSVALIEAIYVRGRFITSIFDAPNSWDDRLASLGFRKASQAWLRLGITTQSEFRFLSPEIQLVGLRAGQVIDVPTEVQDTNPVPYDVRDALLALWQRQVAALLVALSMEHEIHFTRSQAWSYVEAALEGQMTPETETLMGLTFTKMSKEGKFSLEAQIYADSIGWHGLPKSRNINSITALYVKGESVQWTENDGSFTSGRIAQTVHEKDIGCWVYKAAPVWAGGYVVTTPLWINKDQLEIQDPKQADGSRLLFSNNSPTEVLSKFSQDEGATISISSEQRSVLVELISVSGSFPCSDWKSIVRGLSITEDKLTDRVSWLESLENSLAKYSRVYYGSVPVMFAIQGDIEFMEVLLTVNTGDNYEVCSWYSESGVISGSHIDLGSITEKLESERRAKELELKRSSESVGRILSESEPMWPSSAIKPYMYKAWKSVGIYLNNQVVPDSFYAIQSLLVSQSDLILSMPSSDEQNSFVKALTTDMNLSPQFGMGKIKLSVFVQESNFFTVDSLIESLISGNAGSFGIADKNSYQKIYRLKVAQEGGSPIYSLSDVVGLQRSGRVDSEYVYFSSDFNHVLDLYESVLSKLRPYIDQSFFKSFDNLELLINRLPLQQRFYEASARLNSVPRTQLESFVEASLQMSLKGSMASWNALTKDRLVQSVVSQLLTRNAQGVAVSVNMRGNNIQWSSAPLVLNETTIIQSRLAEINGGMADLAKLRNWTGSVIAVDGISLTDPELCQVVNTTNGLSSVRSVALVSGLYEDTGFVSGFAAKDIRKLDSSELQNYSIGMNDQQKSKYITKEMIWPRQSFEETQEKGCGLVVALAADILWKSLPKCAKSPSRLHVATFINLLTSLKKSTLNVVDAFRFASIESTSHPQYLSFAKSFSDAVIRSCESVIELESVYSWKDQSVRGMAHLRWTSFDIMTNSSFWKKSNNLSWSDVLKSKGNIKGTSSYSRVLKDALVRKGTDHRQGRSVSSEDFIRTFGFSGVEYGNWTNSKEREKHLNFAFDSMMDFVEVLNWEPMALSLGGKLGLCIGSRGTGGPRSANAHFEPANMAINLTRMKGDGALAHEYFHAVACHFGLISSGQPNDFTDTFAYGLKRPGVLPLMPKSGVRDEMRRSFFNLMISIMRQPESGGDPSDLTTYQNLSPMLKSSMALEKPGDDYWASPREMFARAMEIWFKSKLSATGKQNDYLVSASKDVGSQTIYPDRDQLSLISHFADVWVNSVRFDICKVDHPFMGTIDMPILNSERKSSLPWSVTDITDLAFDKMELLFRTYAPALAVIKNPSFKSGMYDLANDIVVLNASYADSGVFYHEAWHVCHEKLLTYNERKTLDKTFSTDGRLRELVTASMKELGYDQDVISHALTDTRELQAYAFELWKLGKLSIHSIGEFYRVSGFVDGVMDVAGLFSATEAIRLFERFADGDLAERRFQSDLTRKTAELDIVVGDDPQDWDSDNTIFWSIDDFDPNPGLSTRLRLG